MIDKVDIDWERVTWEELTPEQRESVWKATLGEENNNFCDLNDGAESKRPGEHPKEPRPSLAAIKVALRAAVRKGGKAC